MFSLRIFLYRYFVTILIMVTCSVTCAISKKSSSWLLPFYMAVATYCYYKKVRRTMRTAIVSYLLNLLPPGVNWNNFAWFFLFSQPKGKQGRGDTYRDIEIPRPKHHDIEKRRQLSHDIVIPRHFFWEQKGTTSEFQDWKTTTSSFQDQKATAWSFCEILTIIPPDIT